jgi:hypothetical protein
MIIQILDTIIDQALEANWTIKYVALGPIEMRNLVSEVVSYAGKDFKVDSLSFYKDVPLKVKEIVGFQVAYELPQ